MSETNRLRSVIDGMTANFGVTESGSAWCLKALHPSDPVTSTQGIPDGSAPSSVMMNYQSAFTLQDTTVASTWNFDLWCMPHVVCPATCLYGTVALPSSMPSLHCYNPQIVGSNGYEKTRTFLRSAERHRLCYYSVTLVHNASATTNQGSVASCQHACAERTIYASQAMGGGGSPITAFMPIAMYQLDDYPVYEQMQSMPGSYIGPMREGVYLPLKLTRTCQQWKDSNALRLWTGRDDYSYDITPYRALPTSALTYEPYGLVGPYMSFGSAVMGGEYTFTNMDTNCGYISGRGLSKDSSVTVYIRMGVEMQVNPLSPLAPQQTSAPPEDEVALNTYFAVARLLKDAYSADYNDRDKLWKVINTAAKTVLPAVMNTFLPGSGALADPIINISDDLRKRVQARRQRKKAKRIRAKKARPLKTTITRRQAPAK